MLSGISWVFDGRYRVPETNIAVAPENGWLKDDPFLLGYHLFRCYITFREGNQSNLLVQVKGDQTRTMSQSEKMVGRNGMI